LFALEVTVFENTPLYTLGSKGKLKMRKMSVEGGYSKGKFSIWSVQQCRAALTRYKSCSTLCHHRAMFLKNFLTKSMAASLMALSETTLK
jgi:hypothetical protein